MAKTKREYFGELKAAVAGNEELVAFIDHEIELLSRKNSVSKKATAKQVANEAMKDVILAGLVGKEAMTATEITKDIVIAAGYSADTKVQKVSALLAQLVDDNAVVRTVGAKKKAYFALAD